MKEAEIKAVVISQLLHDRSVQRRALIANEYRLGRSGVRADLAILDETFVGIEIKSTKDSLKRLANQVSAYKLFFDRVIVVASSRHIPNINIGELDVDLWEFRPASNTVKKIVELERREPNPLFLELLTEAERRRNAGDAPMRDRFRTAFAQKFGKTSAAFWEGVGRRRIVSPSDLEALSRFKATRRRALDHASGREAFWSSWADQISQSAPRDDH